MIPTECHLNVPPLLRYPGKRRSLSRRLIDQLESTISQLVELLDDSRRLRFCRNIERKIGDIPKSGNRVLIRTFDVDLQIVGYTVLAKYAVEGYAIHFNKIGLVCRPLTFPEGAPVVFRSMHEKS